MVSRRVLALSAILAGSICGIRADQKALPPANVAFEATSIKRNVSGSGSMSVGVQPGGRFVAVNATILTLVQNAYPYEQFRIVNAPGWATAERYDVIAVAGAPLTRDQFRGRLQTLLRERLNLLTHIETRTLQTYALVRARPDGELGPSLKRWTIDCDTYKSGVSATPPPRTVADFATPPTCGMRGGAGMFAAGGYALGDFVQSLATDLGTVVSDRTGLEGKFEIALRWNPDPSRPNTDNSLPSLFTAVEEQLGLKLDARREPVEVLVIDRIERPTEN
jgi:uncharacterized protein (TIGR03435 family)